MRAIIHSTSPESSTYTLTLDELPVPSYSGQDVLVRVAACGVNRADIFQAQGRYHPANDPQRRLGLEISGIIESIGPDVRSVSVGDEVCAVIAGNGYSEYVAVPEWRLMPVHAGVSLIAAAALPEALMTAWLLLYEKARLKPSETVAIDGATGSVGIHTLQLVKALGNHAIALVSRATSATECKLAGADVIICRDHHDWPSQLKAAAPDVILDVSGGQNTAYHLTALKPHGRLMLMGLLDQANSSLPLGQILMKQLILTGATLASQNEATFYDLAQAMRQQVWPLISSGKIQPVIQACFPLEKASDAHALMQKRHRPAGKILLTL